MLYSQLILFMDVCVESTYRDFYTDIRLTFKWSFSATKSNTDLWNYYDHSFFCSCCIGDVVSFAQKKIELLLWWMQVSPADSFDNSRCRICHLHFKQYQPVVCCFSTDKLASANRKDIKICINKNIKCLTLFSTFLFLALSFRLSEEFPLTEL